MTTKASENSLTHNQRCFVNEYLVDRNATRAYLQAYPSVKKENTARAAASRLLANVKVWAEVEKGLKEQQKRTEITADDTLRETARVAFSDIRKLFNEDGSMKSIHELDEATAAAVSGVDLIVQKSMQGEDGNEVLLGVKKIKLWDKVSALEKLGKHFKLFVERKEVTGKDGDPIQHEHGMSEAAQALLDDIIGTTTDSPAGG